MSYLYCLMSHASSQVCTNPLKIDELSDEELLQSTRFTRPAVRELLHLIHDDIERPTHRHHAVPAESQLVATLQFYASGSFQWMLGRSCRMSQPSVSNAIETVTNSLTKLTPKFITFPSDPQKNYCQQIILPLSCWLSKCSGSNRLHPLCYQSTIFT